MDKMKMKNVFLEKARRLQAKIQKRAENFQRMVIQVKKLQRVLEGKR
jgi:hypothetical protein